MLLASHAAFGQSVKEVADSVKSGVKSGNVKTMVNTVKKAFEAKAASAELLVGTWRYSEPAVLATSGNILMKMAAETAEGKLEKMIRSYFNKSDINSENTYFTFHEDGTYERSIAGHVQKGVWMVGGDKVLLGIKNVNVSTLTTHVEGDKLTLVTAVERMLNGFIALGVLSDSKANKTLIKLIKTMKTVECGFVVTKSTP